MPPSQSVGIILILSGNEAEAVQYAESRFMASHQWRYVASKDDLLRDSGCMVSFQGSFQDRADIQELIAVVKDLAFRSRIVAVEGLDVLSDE